MGLYVVLGNALAFTVYEAEEELGCGVAVLGAKLASGGCPLRTAR